MSDFKESAKTTSGYIIAFCFILTLLLDFIPREFETFFWLPEFSTLMLLYWALNQPQSVSIGIAFIIGILVDTGMAAPFGSHALSYMLMVFVIQKKQIMLRRYYFQVTAVLLDALAVLDALLCNQTILFTVQLMYTHQFTGWQGFAAPFTGMLLWPLFNKMMSGLLNLR